MTISIQVAPDKGKATMASALFHSYDRTLRRIHMLNLVEQMAAGQTGFKASLVVNPRTGRAIEPKLRAIVPSPDALADA